VVLRKLCAANEEIRKHNPEQKKLKLEVIVQGVDRRNLMFYPGIYTDLTSTRTAQRMKQQSIYYPIVVAFLSIIASVAIWDFLLAPDQYIFSRVHKDPEHIDVADLPSHLSNRLYVTVTGHEPGACISSTAKGSSQWDLVLIPLFAKGHSDAAYLRAVYQTANIHDDQHLKTLDQSIFSGVIVNDVPGFSNAQSLRSVQQLVAARYPATTSVIVIQDRKPPSEQKMKKDWMIYCLSVSMVLSAVGWLIFKLRHP
jgi:hypothetical protein